MKDKLLIPVSIVVAGIIIGAGFYFNGKMAKETPTPVQKQQALSRDLSKVMRPIDANDHILGSPDAKVLVVEYSDPECPFCKNFHSTMNQIMQEYGKSGQVAWVYRHFPIAELHSKAQKESEALECAASLGGNSKFWEYVNRLYEVATSNDTLDEAELPKIATDVGLSSEAFVTCLGSGQFAPRVQLDVNNANEIGALGTPYSLIINTKSNEYYPIEGAYPYAQVKQAIDLILQS